MTDKTNEPGFFSRLDDTLEALRWMCGHLYRSELRHSSMIEHLRGLDDLVLYAGGVNVGPNGFAKNFEGRFASLSISDANGLGPIFLSSDGSGLAAASGAGPANFQVKKNCHATIPLSGNALQINAATPGILFVVAYARPQPFFMSETP